MDAIKIHDLLEVPANQYIHSFHRCNRYVLGICYMFSSHDSIINIILQRHLPEYLQYVVVQLKK
ncbi:hypothetical protein HKBW3S44_01871, partial [Candidatus Hakubella thermalkaliphila]